MKDLQSKFAITVVAVGLFFAYAYPTIKQVSLGLDGVASRAGSVYVPPTPGEPNAPSGNVSLDDLQKYADQKAAEQQTLALR